MHYGDNAYSQTGRRTIKSKYDGNEPLGGITLTKYDVQKLNKLYNCNANGENTFIKFIFVIWLNSLLLYYKKIYNLIYQNVRTGKNTISAGLMNYQKKSSYISIF